MRSSLSDVEIPTRYVKPAPQSAITKCLTISVYFCSLLGKFYVFVSNNIDISYSAISPNILDEIQVVEPHVDESSRQLYEVEYLTI